MATKLVSGNLEISVSYNDRGYNPYYSVRMCPIREHHHPACQTVKVEPPRSLKRAVDSPIEMRSAARAAISFARSTIQEQAATDRAGSGWIVKSPRNIRGPRRRRK